MQYFVTGATGFIRQAPRSSKLLVKARSRGAVVHFLMRKGSEGKVARCTSTGVPVPAPCRYLAISSKKLGVSGRCHQGAQGQDRPLLPPGRGLRPVGRRREPDRVNIEGTRNVVDFAKAVDAGHLHHVSSIAAAGLYEGVFREDMFDEAENSTTRTS
jgi:nucleoside-diphosphate-sugar epimerase